MKLSDIFGKSRTGYSLRGQPSTDKYQAVGHDFSSNVWYVLKDGDQLVIEEPGAVLGHEATGFHYDDFVAWGRVDHKLQKISTRAHSGQKTSALWGNKVAQRMGLNYEVLCYSPRGTAEVCG